MVTLALISGHSYTGGCRWEHLMREGWARDPKLAGAVWSQAWRTPFLIPACLPACLPRGCHHALALVWHARWHVEGERAWLWSEASLKSGCLGTDDGWRLCELCFGCFSVCVDAHYMCSYSLFCLQLSFNYKLGRMLMADTHINH